jgi:hypothetical protein
VACELNCSGTDNSMEVQEEMESRNIIEMISFIYIVFSLIMRRSPANSQQLKAISLS